MLYDLSEQVARCYRRAAECKERSESCADLADKAFYLDREQAWLTLARSYELSERVGRVLNERQRQRLLHRPATQRITALEVPNCSACRVEMGLHGIEPMVIDTSKMAFEYAYVQCPNCGRIGNYPCD